MQAETSLDLRYNIAALAIAIAREKQVTPEEALALATGNRYKITDKDTLDMIKMKEVMTYKEVGQVYGISKDNVRNRIRRYKVKKEKDPSDGSLKRSVTK